MASNDDGHAGEAENKADATNVLAFGRGLAPGPEPLADGENWVSHLAELEAENAALREQVRRSRLIMDSAADYAIIMMDIAGRITGWNLGAELIIGYTEAETLGRSGEIVFTSEDRAENRFTTDLCLAIEAGRAVNERWHLRRDGTRFWASGMMMPLLDTTGQREGFLNILRDRSEARAEVERRELLMAEMNHRIKNIFFTIQAVAAQTRRHASSIGEFQAAFESRLGVLARSHDVLIQGNWDDAPLHDVIKGILAAYEGEPGRITIEGPSVLLAAKLVVTVSLVFHELATNAVKHGALSVTGGRLQIIWTLGQLRQGMRHVNVVWREREGPPVQLPQHWGFGSQLLERGISAGGMVQVKYLPEGLECHITLPLGSMP